MTLRMEDIHRMDQLVTRTASRSREMVMSKAFQLLEYLLIVETEGHFVHFEIKGEGVGLVETLVPRVSNSLKTGEVRFTLAQKDFDRISLLTVQLNYESTGQTVAHALRLLELFFSSEMTSSGSMSLEGRDVMKLLRQGSSKR